MIAESLLLIGASITAGCCAEPAYADLLAERYAVQVEGVPGSTAYSLRPDGDTFDALEYDADVALVMFGVNDAIHGWPADAYAANVLAIVDALDVERVCVVGPPAFHSWLPQWPHYLERIAEYQAAFDELDVACRVDLSGLLPEHYDSPSDVHPNAAGHAHIAAQIVQAVPEPRQELAAAAAMLAVAGLRWRARRG